MQVFKLPKMKANLQQIPLFNTTELYSHPKMVQASIWATDGMYWSPLWFRKAASKSRPLKCSLFWTWDLVVHSCTILFMVKSNLLTWVIRLIFSSPVTYVYGYNRGVPIISSADILATDMVFLPKSVLVEKQFYTAAIVCK